MRILSLNNITYEIYFKNNCICYFLIIIGFIGANIFCATKIKDANVEDYIMVNALTIFIMAMLWLMSLLLDD